MAARFRASYDGIGAMLRAKFMQAEMKTRAERVKQVGEQTAPVDEEGPHPGRYRDAFEVSSGVRHGKTARAYGRVENTAPESFAVEFGTKHNDAHHTLGKALDAARD